MKVKIVKRIDIELDDNEFEMVMNALEHAGEGNNGYAMHCAAMHRELAHLLREEEELLSK